MAAPQTAGTPEPKKTAKKADDFDIYKHCGVTKRFTVFSIGVPFNMPLRLCGDGSSSLAVGQGAQLDQSSGKVELIEICNDGAFILVTTRRGNGLRGYILQMPSGSVHEVRYEVRP